MVGACTRMRKQSSPVIRWHSETCGSAPASSATFESSPGCRPDPGEGADRQPERGRVDLHVVAGDHSIALHPLDPLGHGGGGHPDHPPSADMVILGLACSSRSRRRLVSSDMATKVSFAVDLGSPGRTRDVPLIYPVHLASWFAE